MSRSDFTRQWADDLLRSSLTYAASALDRYAHERFTKGIVGALKRRDLSKHQQELTLGAAEVIKLADRICQTMKSQQTIRPANEIRNKLQEDMHGKPLQSWKEIEYAFDLIGIGDFSGRMQNALRVSDLKPVRAQLNRIIQKRNLIVHEGDLVRHQRGGRPQHNPIRKSFVVESVAFLDNLVDKMDTIR